MHIYSHTNGIYWTGLWTMIQLAQHWLLQTKGQRIHPVAVQSTGLIVSAGFYYISES